ncbi:hypothetical protein MASR2M17_06480 [Aminivibrio sp.]
MAGEAKAAGIGSTVSKTAIPRWKARSETEDRRSDGDTKVITKDIMKHLDGRMQPFFYIACSA